MKKFLYSAATFSAIGALIAVLGAPLKW